MTILRDGINHINPQLHTAVGVIRTGIRNPTDTVVAVSQQLDPQTVVLVGQLVKPGSQEISRFCGRIVEPWRGTKTDNLLITWRRVH